ncbi:ABC transporter substrate-binding protein [Rhodococcus sp. TAF43]|uniref:ABC transporter substrate-binding protein n=1 Tax=unclassified Rhodococcus (in: high G+C Gram-positive bacteria) TaxID=192944 RepID=UPI000E0A3BAC|nr:MULTISPECIES: ABC transporter substrate-binding protein [unclassified Rhodococcus (in: high G+C Gram-positive bacteria)]QKT09699.1 ABC transporter substrate-binding protein [Rhodococcus sp. W8901]RDI28247.1 ABC-type nitrate/sulfonate/bicarbonate transport system substrate-binding protein [Rhodococcus sp. AG1013]
MSTFRTRAAKTVAIAATAVGAITLGACGGNTSAADGSVMKVGVTQGVPGDLIAVVAENEGFFDKRGVNVELMPPSLTTAQSAAVISNDLTVGTMVPGTLWPAVDKGACVKALGSTLGNTLDVIAQPGTEIKGDPTDPDTTMKSLQGKTIGVTSRGSGMELWITELLNEAGLDPAKDVTFVAVGAPATAIQAFNAKQVDAMYYGPTMEEQLPPSKVTRVTDIVGRDGNALSPLVQGYPSASCDTIEQRPNDVLNYCKAMWDAYDYSRDPQNAATMAKWLGELVGVSPEGAPALWESIKDVYLPFTITEDSWAAQAPLAGSPAPQVPDFADTVHAPCAGGDPR